MVKTEIAFNGALVTLDRRWYWAGKGEDWRPLVEGARERPRRTFWSKALPNPMQGYKAAQKALRVWQAETYQRLGVDEMSPLGRQLALAVNVHTENRTVHEQMAKKNPGPLVAQAGADLRALMDHFGSYEAAERAIALRTLRRR